MRCRDRDRRTFVDDFPEQMVELPAFLRHAFPPDHPFGQIKVSPDMPGGPEVWLLGSSMWSATAAAQLGLPYAFAHFINPGPTRAAIEYYHSHVTASGVSVPQTILALGVICADTEAEAQRLNASVRLRRVVRELGADPGPIHTPEEALAQLGAGPDRAAPGRR